MGANVWSTSGKNGSSLTTKSGNFTATFGPKGTTSTYRSAGGSFRNYVSRNSRSNRSAKKGFGDGEILIGAIVFVVFLAFTYPIAAFFVGASCIIGVIFWWMLQQKTDEKAVSDIRQSVDVDDEHSDSEQLDDKDDFADVPVAKSGGRPWFKVLNVSPKSSTIEDAKASRNNLAKIYHSDHLRANDEKVNALADQKLAEVNTAYRQALDYYGAGKRISNKNSKHDSSENEPQDRKEFFFSDEADRSELQNLVAEAVEDDEPLGHVLVISGSETAAAKVAQLLADDLHVNCREISGPLIKVGDLAACLTNLEDRDTLFIGNICELSAETEDVLCSAMKDCTLELVIGEGKRAKTVLIDLPPFTIICAAASADWVSGKIRRECSYLLHLDS